MNNTEILIKAQIFMNPIESNMYSTVQRLWSSLVTKIQEKNVKLLQFPRNMAAVEE
jgi:hypothetical protein